MVHVFIATNTLVVQAKCCCWIAIRTLVLHCSRLELQAMLVLQATGWHGVCCKPWAGIVSHGCKPQAGMVFVASHGLVLQAMAGAASHGLVLQAMLVL